MLLNDPEKGMPFLIVGGDMEDVPESPAMTDGSLPSIGRDSKWV